MALGPKSTNKEVIEEAFNLRDKRGGMVRFRFNKAQAFYWARKTRRNIIIKARQKGISKVIDADQVVDCIKKTINAILVSHEKESTKRLFSSVRGFIENATIKTATSIDSKSEIKFAKTGSSYFIGTAGQRAFGRGDTVHRAHLSEASFYPDLEKILTGIEEAAEYGVIDIETTPNGRDEVYERYQKAKKGLSAYTPIFIPWYIDQEYSSDNMTAEEKAGLSRAVREMFVIPDKEFMASLKQEEKDLIRRVQLEHPDLPPLTAGQIKWRRYKLLDKGDLFFQEYPEDDESCFLQTGRSVFTRVTVQPQLQIPLDNLDAWRDPDGRPVAAEHKNAILKRRMYAGLDGAEGTPNGDAHSFSVIDVAHPFAPKGKAVVVFEITSNEPIDMFDARVRKICKAYNIHLGVEKNGVGLAHVQRLDDMRVRHDEWETTAANRPTMITDLEEAYRQELLIETYPEAEGELRDMEYTDKRSGQHTYRMEAKAGKHDDRVFSRAIAWQMRHVPVPAVYRL